MLQNRIVLQFGFPIYPVQLCHLATLRHTANNADATSLIELLTESKQIQTGFPKSTVHETVRNGIAATGTVGQQMKIANRLVAKVLVDQLRIE